MGKAEERCWVDCVELCEESLMWFEGMPAVVGDEPMAAGFFYLVVFCCFIVVLCNRVHFERKNVDNIIISRRKKVDYESCHLRR